MKSERVSHSKGLILKVIPIRIFPNIACVDAACVDVFVQDKNEWKAAIRAVYLSKICVTVVPFLDPFRTSETRSDLKIPWDGLPRGYLKDWLFYSSSSPSWKMYVFMIFYRTPINYLLVNLSVADILYATLITPNTFHGLTSTQPDGWAVRFYANWWRVEAWHGLLEFPR